MARADANGAAREARAGVTTRGEATCVVLAVDRKREVDARRFVSGSDDKRGAFQKLHHP